MIERCDEDPTRIRARASTFVENTDMKKWGSQVTEINGNSMLWGIEETVRFVDAREVENENEVHKLGGEQSMQIASSETHFMREWIHCD